MKGVAAFTVFGLANGEVPIVQIAAGVNLPMVSLGTGSGMVYHDVDVANATALWIAAGGTGIDTAYGYKDESKIAAGIERAGVPRSRVFVTTKIPCAKTYSSASKMIQSNLDQLKMDEVNLTLIHFPDGCNEQQIAETWRALEDARAAGKTHAIGVSNFEVENFEALAKTQRVQPALNQYAHSVKYHKDSLIEYAAAKGIVHMSYSPLCGGFNGSSCSHGNVLSLPELKKIGEAHSISSAQVALKWIVQSGHPLATAVWNPQHMVEDLDLWSWGNLTDNEMQLLNSLAGASSVII